MKQIRKFEQEAIVNQIMEGVKERLNSSIDKAKKSKEYKAISNYIFPMKKFNYMKFIKLIDTI